MKTFDKKLSYILRRNKLKKTTITAQGKYQRCFTINYDFDNTDTEITPLERFSIGLQSCQPNATSLLFTTQTQESTPTSATSNGSNSNSIQRINPL